MNTETNKKKPRKLVEAYFAARKMFKVPNTSGMNNHLHKSYSTVDDIIAAVEPALVANGILLETIPLTDRMIYKLTLVESGEERVIGEYPVVWKSPDGIVVAQAMGWAARGLARALGLHGVKTEADETEGLGF